MQQTRNILFLLLSSLLIIQTSCEPPCSWNNASVSEIEIELDWSAVKDPLPDGMRAIFYSKDTHHKVDVYLPVEGGTVKLMSGRYAMVIYNYNTESILIRGEESYETIEAYTGYCTGLGRAGTEQMVWEPDKLYVVSETELYVTKSNEKRVFRYQPKLVVKTYSFNTEVAGLQYVRNVVGHVEGMADCYHLGTGTKQSSGSPIYFELSLSGSAIKGSFNCYGSSLQSTTTRLEALLKLTLTFVKLDNSTQEVEMDITEVIQKIEDEEAAGGGSGEPGGLPPQIELPVQDEGITIEKPENPPVGGGGGGIGGDVGDWGDEDDVPLPVK